MVFPQHQEFALLGTAFDYAARVLTKAKFPIAKQRGLWIAQEAAIAAAEKGEPIERVIAMADVVEKSIAIFNRRVINDDFAWACINLANLDKFIRVGNMPKYVPYNPDHEMLADLKRLSKVFLDNFPMPQEDARLNPTFGAGSELVGGADADLIFDGTLVDIKTTKNWALTIDYINQLIGYVILRDYNKGVVDPGGYCEIRKVGIYFSRHGHLVTWDINSLISAEGRSRLLAFFEDFALEMGAESDDPSSWFGGSPENDFNGIV